MSRSTKKGPYVDARLLVKAQRARNKPNAEPIKTWARSCTVIPDFVGVTFSVHNGKTFTKVFITEEMVGQKLGEFTLTRTFRGHGQNKAATA
ncbi:MAG: 30S ribosomal protein S19 [Planctomycetes bacterium]|nr:30S ribosomal protein S19 [Planctomycetota bacterium]